MKTGSRGNELQKALALETRPTASFSSSLKLFLSRFRTALSSKLVPVRHPQILQLANNVANCYFYAAKVPGSKKDACWEGAGL